uniref:Rabaptin, RAB GTPase binding effector protein 2 n=1 Tax=Ictidomys tridecemlineatus TaxID=43179 RepID=I3N2N8_ICTTR
MKAVAEVSESTKAEAVAAVQRQCQEEVASLQAILKDSISSYEAQIASLKQERQQQQQDSEEKERELGHLKQLLARAHPLDSLEKQMEKGRQLQKDLESVSRERDELQEGLRRSTEDCAKQMQVLLAQVQNSEQLLRTLQGTVSQAQERVQLQMARASLEGQLRVQREETEVLEASLCSLRTEMDRIQQEQSQAQLTDLLSEQRAKVLRLQAELETSEQVQRDFVRLSQALQVRLERIRQAGTLEQVRCILDEGSLKDVRDIKDT